MNRAQSGGISDNDHSKHYGNNYTSYQIKHEPLPEIDLNEALQTLQALPTEVVPPASPEKIPSWSLFQARPQTHFVGRDQELLKLARQLKQRKISIVVTGIGGVGKSTLASEFVQRYGGYFAGGVFWISFVDPQSAQASIAQCGLSLRLFHEKEGLSQAEQIARVRAEWQKPIPRLLVFDNCDNLKANECQQFLADYIPQIGECRVLITSRNSLWPEGKDLQSLALEILERSASIELFQSYSPDISDADANTIAEELGDLPLALTLASKFLKKYRISANYYLEQIKKKKLDHHSLRSVETGERNVFATFDLSFQRLEKDNPNDTQAIALLTRAMYFAPNQPIPQELLLATLDLPENEDAEEARYIRIDALHRLLELGLLEQDDKENLLIHRLVASYIQIELADPQVQVDVEDVLIDTTHDLISNRIPSKLQPILPHLYYRNEASTKKANLHYAELTIALGCAEQEISNYQQAEVHYQQALELFENLLGTFHPYTASVLNNLATLYQQQWLYDKAEHLYLRAHFITQLILGDVHLDTANSLNNLAALYQEQGRFNDAYQPSLEAYNIYKEILGDYHVSTAKSICNLAGLYHKQGDFNEAELLYIRALSIQEQILDGSHPDIAISLNNLAELYREQGRFEDAEPLCKRSLKINSQVLGLTHLLTISSYNNLVLIYMAQGRYNECKLLLEQIFSLYEQNLGTEHPSITLLLNNVGLFYKIQGHYREAEASFQRALHINKQVLGNKHPYTAASLNNLADVYHQQGLYAQAQPLYQQALSILEEVLGIEHYSTKPIRENLEVNQKLTNQSNYSLWNLLKRFFRREIK